MYAIVEARRTRRDHDPRERDFDIRTRERQACFDEAASGHRQGELEHPGSSKDLQGSAALWCTVHFGNGQRERDVARGGRSTLREIVDLRAKRRITRSGKAKT